MLASSIVESLTISNFIHFLMDSTETAVWQCKTPGKVLPQENADDDDDSDADIGSCDSDAESDDEEEDDSDVEEAAETGIVFRAFDTKEQLSTCAVFKKGSDNKDCYAFLSINSNYTIVRQTDSSGVQHYFRGVMCSAKRTCSVLLRNKDDNEAVRVLSGRPGAFRKTPELCEMSLFLFGMKSKEPSSFHEPKRAMFGLSGAPAMQFSRIVFSTKNAALYLTAQKKARRQDRLVVEVTKRPKSSVSPAKRVKTHDHRHEPEKVVAPVASDVPPLSAAELETLRMYIPAMRIARGIFSSFK